MAGMDTFGRRLTPTDSRALLKLMKEGEQYEWLQISEFEDFELDVQKFTVFGKKPSLKKRLFILWRNEGRSYRAEVNFSETEHRTIDSIAMLYTPIQRFQRVFPRIATRWYVLADQADPFAQLWGDAPRGAFLYTKRPVPWVIWHEDFDEFCTALGERDFRINPKTGKYFHGPSMLTYRFGKHRFYRIQRILGATAAVAGPAVDSDDAEMEDDRPSAPGMGGNWNQGVFNLSGQSYGDGYS